MSDEIQHLKDVGDVGDGGNQAPLELRQAQKMVALGRLAGTMAHDFNNILAAALMQLGLLRQSPQLPKEMKTSLQAIEAELARAASLTRQLLLFNPHPVSKADPADLKLLAEAVNESSASKTALKNRSHDSEEIRGGSETILLVDDDLALRRMTALCLRKLGYAVFEAANTTEALNFWSQRKQTIDLLFTDMTMPGSMTGLELAQRLKGERPSLRVIVSTGYATELAESQPFCDKVVMLPKPYLPPTLATAVRQCLDNSA